MWGGEGRRGKARILQFTVIFVREVGDRRGEASENFDS